MGFDKFQNAKVDDGLHDPGRYKVSEAGETILGQRFALSDHYLSHCVGSWEEERNHCDRDEER